MNYSDLFTRTSTKTLHSIACGNDSRPLHFLHANGFCAGVYLPFFEHLENDTHILATDIPGHGDSDHHGLDRIEHWNIFVDDIKDTLVKQMEPPVVGVGHSLGAVVSLLAAVRYPELFSHLVLIEPVIFSPLRLALVWMAKKTGMIHKAALAQGARRRKKDFSNKEEAYLRFSSGRGLFRTWPDPFIRAYCDHGLYTQKNGHVTLKCDPETEAQIYESLLLDIWSYPGKVTCPTLVIRGESSDTFTRAAARRLAVKLPKAQSKEVSQAGHFAVMEAPETCRELILDFVSEYS